MISCIVKNVAGRLRSETRLPIVWLDNPRKPSKELIVKKYSLSKLQGNLPRITEEPWEIPLPELVPGKLIGLSDLGYPNLANKLNKQAKSCRVF